jgi:transcriptional regulator with XRE-family HTH domain
MPDRTDDFAQRLRELTREFGSRYALAKATGIPQSSLQSYETGTKPGMDALVHLARVGNVDLNWLVRGAGEMRPPGMLPGAVFADILVVDQYELGTPEAMEAIIGQIPFSRHSLEKRGIKEPTHKTLLVVEAGSKLWSIKPGDLVLIDRSQAKLSRDGVYLLDLPGLELRGLFVFPGGRVNVVGPDLERQQFERRGRGRQRKAANSMTMRRSELLGGAGCRVVGRAVLGEVEVWVGDRT